MANDTEGVMVLVLLSLKNKQNKTKQKNHICLNSSFN